MQLLPLMSLSLGFLSTGKLLVMWKLDSNAQVLIRPRRCYRPFPYHPFGSSQSFSDLADSEGTRLHALFEAYAQAAVARS